ncbi:hypothetical protein SPF06_00425 [Sinomonas sp. JGH33]|uniref:Uncharacterized protein n=1 Tax=Sinomonas terricola TaxID=3110330 RepID=A0ABU5T0J5_9MICC|nr:hypothetical protein [Sinomonas sp. JGH33]MEA5453173.1 hypothetical protein [Sinomonas sp. JGH33]
MTTTERRRFNWPVFIAGFGSFIIFRPLLGLLWSICIGLSLAFLVIAIRGLITQKRK